MRICDKCESRADGGCIIEPDDERIDLCQKHIQELQKWASDKDRSFFDRVLGRKKTEAA